MALMRSIIPKIVETNREGRGVKRPYLHPLFFAGSLCSEHASLNNQAINRSGQPYNWVGNPYRALVLLLTCILLIPINAEAAPAAAPTGNILGLTSPLEVLLFLTLLSFLPALLVMTTCFIRIVVVFSFLRQAMGTPQVPPNTIVVGLALFITIFVMSPVLDRIYQEAYVPYTNKQISGETALQRMADPLKEFMLKQTREKDLALFLRLSKAERPAKPMDLSLKVVIPAFAIGELKKAFEISFLLFLPFLVLDMVVASVLLSMGMMMLPPVMVSMPFKLLLFVLVDGWGLLVGSLVGSFK